MGGTPKTSRIILELDGIPRLGIPSPMRAGVWWQTIQQQHIHRRNQQTKPTMTIQPSSDSSSSSSSSSSPHQPSSPPSIEKGVVTSNRRHGGGGGRRRRRQQQKKTSLDTASSWSDVFAVELDVQNNNNNKNHFLPCDRRLSRAARFIVQKLILDFFQSTTIHRHHHRYGSTTTLINENIKALLSDYNDNIQTINVEDLLRLLLPPLPPPVAVNHRRDDDDVDDDDQLLFCPFQLEQVIDVFEHERNHTKLLNARTFRTQWIQGRHQHTSSISHLILNLPSRGYSYNPYLYQCLYCQKVFTTQYYLDQHMQNKHGQEKQQHEQQHDNSNNNNKTMNEGNKQKKKKKIEICLSRDWCQFLPDYCHEKALELESYYGPGSEGRRQEDRSTIYTKLWKQAHIIPCTHDRMKQAKESCQNMLRTCFPRRHDNNNDNNNNELQQLQWSFREYWQSRVCDQLSCPNRLHRLFFTARQEGDAILRHVSDWQEEWNLWSSEYNFVLLFGTLKNHHHHDDDNNVSLVSFGRIMSGDWLHLLLIVIVLTTTSVVSVAICCLGGPSYVFHKYSQSRQGRQQQRRRRGRRQQQQQKPTNNNNNTTITGTLIAWIVAMLGHVMDRLYRPNNNNNNKSTTTTTTHPNPRLLQGGRKQRNNVNSFILLQRNRHTTKIKPH